MNEHSVPASGQVIQSAAHVYESFFVPALFGQWPDRVLDVAGLQADDAVLDVGCGTGIAARTAAERLDTSGSVTGVDVNDAMLAVARKTSNTVVWRNARAEALPFPGDSFDRVVSQFMLMFLDDPGAGVAEMRRVARPGGTVTIATWADSAESPGYHCMIGLLDRLFGERAAAAMRAPFTLGTEAKLRVACGDAGEVSITRHAGVAQFHSIDEWVHTDVRGWTLADMIDDDQFNELLACARTELGDFVDPDGQVRFVAPALIARLQV